MENFTFKSATVLITGASSGIGKAFAESLASKGANLILTARTESELVKLSQELTSLHTNININIIALDLSKIDSAKQLISRIDELNLTVDFLINNAGFGKWCKFSKETYATYESMLLLNINSLLELTYHYLPHLVEKNKGGVINVASIASFQPLPYQAVYAASKSFVLSFTEALYGELLDTNVHVMALCPGVTKSRFMAVANADTTGMSASLPEDVVNTALKAYSKRRTYVIEGTANYFQSLIARFVTRKKVVKIVVDMFKNRV